MLINQKSHFPLKCFSLICITLKVLKLHPYRAKVQWVTTKKVLKDLMLLLVFFYIPATLINALLGTQQIKDMKTLQQVLAQPVLF